MTNRTGEVIEVPLDLAGKSKPYIDGQLDDNDVARAYHGVFEGSQSGQFEFYAKVVRLTNDDQPLPPKVDVQNQLYLGMRISHSLITEGSSKWVNIYFDEGDDGSFGSGNGDLVLTNNQEDHKRIDNSVSSSRCAHFYGFVRGCPDPVCDPRHQNNCWECNQYRVLGENLWSGDRCLRGADETNPTYGRRFSLLDGLWDTRGFGTGWYTEGPGNEGAYDRINHLALYKLSQGSMEVEFLIPLVGVDAYSGGTFDDESDLNICTADQIGIGVLVWLDNGETAFPTLFDKFNPLSFATMKIPPRPCRSMEGSQESD